MADWMAFSPADYVANTLHLTARQHGGYILLICAAWAGKGFLPGTDAGLMAIAKLSAKEWREDGDALKAFLTRRGDAWVHERVEFEWNDAQALIAAKSKAGKEGARRRWLGRANAERMAVPSQTQRQNDAPIPEPSSEAKASGAGEPDAASVIFNQGLAWLKRASGRSDADCRAQLGKWRKAIGDEALIAALGRAQREGAIDAMGWMEKAIAAVQSPRPTRGEPAPTIEHDTDGEWRVRLKDYRPGKFWNPMWGPKPGQPGCFVPSKILAEFPNALPRKEAA